MHHITFDNCEQKSPHDTKVIHPVYHFHEFNLKIDVKKFEGLLRKASSQKFVINSSTLDTIIISVPQHHIWQLWVEVPWRENWTTLYTLHIISVLYTPAYYFIQVKSTVKTNYICTRGQFGPLHNALSIPPHSKQ